MPLKQLLVSASKDGSILTCSISVTLVDYSDFKSSKRSVLSYGHPKEDHGHKESILAMDVSFDGKYLVTAGREAVIKVWNLNDRSFVGDMNGHKGPINVGII